MAVTGEAVYRAEGRLVACDAPDCPNGHWREKRAALQDLGLVVEVHGKRYHRACLQRMALRGEAP